MKKYDILVDEKQFEQLKKEATEHASRVLEGIEVLKAEGIPTDEITLGMLTATPDALENYIRECANSQIGKGFVPQEEKSRIYEVYSKLLARIKDKFHLMRESLKTTPILFKKDAIEIDWKKLEQIAKNRATYEVDNEGINQYWEKVEAVEKSLNELRQHEIKNNLPDFRNSGLAYTDNGSFQCPKLSDFFNFPHSKELFETIARHYFLKK
ncbi:MAG: hypothetical protein VB024_07810 [Dysgonamonadaceae bacterium]|nr:hypothetical protein [Dysgonamonadaceae bacterium]